MYIEPLGRHFRVARGG